jgi:transposase
MRSPQDKIRARLLRLESERGAISERIRASQLNADDQRILLFLVRIVPWLLRKLKKKTLLVGKLKDMLWGKKSESARDILKEIDEEATLLAESTAQSCASDPVTLAPKTVADPLTTQEPDANHETIAPAKPAPNNVIPITKGKRKYKKDRKSSPRGKAAYPGVAPIVVSHTELKSGDKCPKCKKGRVYPIKKMGVFIKWVGQSCLKAIVYLQQKLRCNGCGWVFGAKMPTDVVSSGSESACAMIAVLKYGCAFPFFRLSRLQGWLKMPLSPSALWNQLKGGLIEVVEVVWQYLRKMAAQGEVVHNDDTVGKVLSLMQKSPKDPRLPGEVKPKKKTRKAISTTGILSKVSNIRILLFFTGHANAGENLEELLKARDQCLTLPIQMSDAGTTNRPGKEQVQESLCLTHGRRGFVRAYRAAKKACAYVILKLQEIYKIEAQAKREGLGSEERLKLHQEKSGPVMAELKAWFDRQIETKQVEPNSPLGEAIEYMRNHWLGLTAFLRIPGAPITNDELEQAFKNVKIYLKNALFYKTLFGAKVGDMMMSVIHTTVLAGENPWEYLVEIQKNREAVKKDPGAWMPWNFRQAIAAAGDCKISA